MSPWRKVMTEDPDYEVYTDEQGNRRARLREGGERCDFCLAPNPTWEYPAAPMEILGHPVITDSDDNWGACDACHQLIAAHNIGGLVERCVKMQPAHKPPRPPWIVYPPLPIFRRTQRRNILRFMDARTGPPRRYTPGPPERYTP